MNVKPLSDRVLILPNPAEEKTAGGLIIPDTAKEKPLAGKVAAVLGEAAHNAARKTVFFEKKPPGKCNDKQCGSNNKQRPRRFRIDFLVTVRYISGTFS